MNSTVMDVENEIRDLKRRVGEIEGSQDFLTQQLKGVHRDLLAFPAASKQEFERVHRHLRDHDGRFGRLQDDIRGLRTDMPRIVASAMREVLGEQPRTPRKR